MSYLLKGMIFQQDVPWEYIIENGIWIKRIDRLGGTNVTVHHRTTR